MNFSVQMDEKIAKKLRRLAERLGKTRNAAINDAVALWLDQQARSKWPKDLLEWKGVPDLVPFESFRSKGKRPPPQLR